MKFRKVLTEDLQLYKGVFWILDPDNVDTSRDYCFLIPCDIYGNSLDPTLNLNAKSGATYNHERLWNSLSSKYTHNKKFNYYPRGRVEISNGKATVYLNPIICTDDVKKFIISEFNLNAHNGIKKVVFHADGSEHYKCHLD